MSSSINRAQIRADILRLLRNHGHKGFRPKEIARRLNLRDRQSFLASREILHDLASEGEIARIKGGRFTLRKKEQNRIGTLSVNPRGFGFVAVDGEDEDYFVSPEQMGTALDGDRVEIKLHRPSREDDERREASVERIVERKRASIVGTFRRKGHYGIVEPDDRRLIHSVYIQGPDFGGALDDQKVVAAIDRFTDPDDGPEGHIVQVLGDASDPYVASIALAMTYDVRIGFEENVEEEARALTADTYPDPPGRRLDLRGKPAFTIDPVDAKDFDDAVHVLPLENGNLDVGVHIADVSHYVRPDTLVDKEAYTRGTSTYLVDQTIPMLPERLSNDLCSLVPRTDKRTFSCLLEVTPEGDVVDYEIRETLIHSHERFSYEQAQKLIDGVAEHPLGEQVRRANRLAQALTRRRMREGSIDFNVPEVRIVLDERGHAVDVVPKPRLHSHRLVEELMLLANRTVAEHAHRRIRDVPFVYRNHGQPDFEKIQDLARYVGAFGYSLPLHDGKVRPEDLSELLHRVQDTPHDIIVEQAAIRAMAKAEYGVENIGHFGLGFEFYTHFTSPIRRYPDLLVHRLLKRDFVPLPDGYGERLPAYCRHCSEQERAAETAERESVKLKQVEFMQDHIGEQYAGVVQGVTKFGVFVEINDLLVEGLVHVRDMDGYFEYDERRYALVDRRSGRTFRLGDAVEVIVAAANLESRQIDFVFPP